MSEQIEVKGDVITPDVVLDARGLACPMPLLKSKLALKTMNEGEVLLVQASDGGSWRDIPAYLNQVSHELLVAEQREKDYSFWIKK